MNCLITNKMIATTNKTVKNRNNTATE